MSQETSEALPKGTVLADEYRIEEVLGVGGFGITYRAHDAKLDLDVAIKEYFPGSMASRSAASTIVPRSSRDREQFEWGLARFLDEAKRLARLSHPNIVRCSRYFTANDTGYFVMSLERGQTLADHFKARPTQAEIDELVEPLLGALETLHNGGVYHRDLSPDNILMRDDGSPVLLDFGASRQEFASRSKTLAAIVKPGYSPIEQYDTATRQQGAWSDIYAMGATLYELICGAPPPEATSRVQKDTYIPAGQAARGAYRVGFLEAIDWALMVHPDERPGSVREWRRKLLAQPAGRPVQTAATRLGGMPGRPMTAVTRFATSLLGGAGGGEASPTASRRTGWALGALALAGAGLGLYLVAGGPGDGVDSAAAEAERSLPILAKNSEAVWKRSELVLKSLGHIPQGPSASEAELRQGLKRYQKAIGERANGYFSDRVLNRILDEPVELAAFAPEGASSVGQWFTDFGKERCFIKTAATRVEGRTLALARPVAEFGVEAKEKDRLLVYFQWAPLFDTGAPVTFVSGGTQHVLTYDGESYLFGKEGDGTWSEEVTTTLRLAKSEFQIVGTSALGGILRLTFPVAGFEDAFRAMNKDCGADLLSWIDTWGGVVVSDEDQFFWSSEVDTEAHASALAMKACTDEVEAKKCKAETTFNDGCFAMVRAKRKNGEDTWSWSTRDTVEEAKEGAMKECAKAGSKDCEINVTFCSDGSNAFNKSN